MKKHLNNFFFLRIFIIIALKIQIIDGCQQGAVIPHLLSEQDVHAELSLYPIKFEVLPISSSSENMSKEPIEKQIEPISKSQWSQEAEEEKKRQKNLISSEKTRLKKFIIDFPGRYPLLESMFNNEKTVSVKNNVFNLAAILHKFKKDLIKHKNHKPEQLTLQQHKFLAYIELDPKRDLDEALKYCYKKVKYYRRKPAHNDKSIKKTKVKNKLVGKKSKSIKYRKKRIVMGKKQLYLLGCFFVLNIFGIERVDFSKQMASAKYHTINTSETGTVMIYFLTNAEVSKYFESFPSELPKRDILQKSKKKQKEQVANCLDSQGLHLNDIVQLERDKEAAEKKKKQINLLWAEKSRLKKFIIASHHRYPNLAEVCRAERNYNTNKELCDLAAALYKFKKDLIRNKYHKRGQLAPQQHEFLTFTEPNLAEAQLDDILKNCYQKAKILKKRPIRRIKRIEKETIKN